MVDFSKIYSTEDGISINDTTGIISGDIDPSSVSPGTDIPESALYIRQDNNSVYQKTGPGDTDWTVLPIFGSEYQYVESEGFSVTTSTTFLNKVTLTTPTTLPAGTYRIGWSYRYNHNSNSNDFEGQVDLDNGTIIDFVKVEPKDNGGNIGGSGSAQRMVASGFKQVVLAAGTHTIDVNYRSDTNGVNSAIWETRLELWRVA